MSSAALTPEHLQRSKKYTRFMIGLLEVQAFLIMGLAYYFYKSGYSEQFAVWTFYLTENYYVGLLIYSAIFFGAISLFTIIATAAKYVLDRRFGLIKAPFGAWLRSIGKLIWIQFLAGVVASVVVFTSARFMEFDWWIPAALLATVYVYLLFQWYTPAMLAAFGPQSRFPEGILRARLKSLCLRSGVPVREIYEWQIGERSTIGNAMVAGLGNDRRILISDTMCKLCTDQEIEAILAHELAHVANKDVRTRFLYRLVTQIVICWIICKGGQTLGAEPTDFGYIPAFWLAYSILSIYAQLALASRSRRQERAADLYAWKLMGTSKSFISGLQKLTAANLVHVKKGSKRFGHPSLEERMAAAEQFEAQLPMTSPLIPAQ
jgi:STE24 endopeptidase